MGKYRITTESGTYEVTTEDTPQEASNWEKFKTGVGQGLAAPFHAIAHPIDTLNAMLPKGPGSPDYKPGEGSGFVVDTTRGLVDPETRSQTIGNLIGGLPYAALEFVPPAARAVVDVVRKPGVGKIATGAAMTTAGGVATAAGHPYIGGSIVGEGARRTVAGVREYRASKVPPATPKSEPVPTTPSVAEVIPEDPIEAAPIEVTPKAEAPKKNTPQPETKPPENVSRETVPQWDPSTLPPDKFKLTPEFQEAYQAMRARKIGQSASKESLPTEPAPAARVDSTRLDELFAKLKRKLIDEGALTQEYIDSQGHTGAKAISIEDYKLGTLPQELKTFDKAGKIIIDSAKRKAYSTAEVANPTMITIPRGARIGKELMDMLEASKNEVIKQKGRKK